MSEWFGDDGQKYDSWDKWVGANNRYRQQKEQTEAGVKIDFGHESVEML